MQQPLSNPKKRVIYLGLMLNFHVRKTRTSALNRHCNANKSSVDDVSMLCKQGRLKDALHILHVVDLHADSSTYVSLLRACIKESALSQGKLVHAHMNETGFTPDVFLHNTIVNMYAKCGSLVDARRAFDQMPKINLSSWNAMIAAYARQNLAEEAFTLFHQMRRTGIQPDQFTFASIIPACLVDKGRQYFESMSCFHIMPGMEHYVCMVDLLGRAGHLDEAEDFINKMPVEPDATVWRCLLGACRVHNNLEIAEHAAEHLFQLDPENAANYVLLSNIYAAVGRWDGIQKMRKMMKDRRVKRTPGCSWIEVNKQVHTFLVGDRSHQENVGEAQKEQILCHHKEKLALALGQISASPWKVTWVIEPSILPPSSSSRLLCPHHFKDGCCSFGVYWSR
eukprot:Gb_38243 [translate_table: standard]